MNDSTQIIERTLGKTQIYLKLSDHIRGNTFLARFKLKQIKMKIGFLIFMGGLGSLFWVVANSL